MGLREALLDPAAALRVGQVRGEHLDRDPVPMSEGGGGGGEPVGAAGDQDEVVPGGGQLGGEFGADPCAGPGDEGAAHAGRSRNHTAAAPLSRPETTVTATPRAPTGITSETGSPTPASR